MLDDVVIKQVKEREIKEKRPERRDSGWQPIPLYEELEVPRDDSQEKGSIEVEIWGPQNGSVVDHDVVTVLDCYSPNKYFIGFW